ncbi:MAG: P-II family nitrogen regulator [Treponema sp.]|nr:transcriptional regulator [Treponema sp.]MCI6593203.1 transcriptional regulator [Spirochaetia bacterium]MDD7533857.1 transcriptional regulator [Treponema sp.]MDY5758738.1 P-II family nitrogen regulator [Treponema sp.]MDY5819592.1 P-II family nitrogen regulator [Treponema sp.]
MGYKLLISIVPHDSGELIANAAKSAGAGGGTITMGRGTASNGVLQLLGLGDTSKDIVYIIIKENLKEAVYNEIIKASEKKSHFGVIFTLNTPDFIRAGHLDEKSDGAKGEETMKNEKNYQMINIIVNKGYAEDAMAAARKAGAGGGTIIGARGTAKEGDAAFFGMKIVPEKEMLMILVPAEKKNDIVSAITELPCFAEAGSGIIFCNEAQDFTLLGKK